jgi:hypothetical protein
MRSRKSEDETSKAGWEEEVRKDRGSKKEEFPGNMENMLPGNSFPQICVVSVNEYVENKTFPQGHESIQHLSNKKQLTTYQTPQHPAQTLRPLGW